MNASRTRCALSALGIAATLGLAPHAHAQSQPYIGQIMCAGFSFAPAGWAALDGQMLFISSNTALFSLLGTTFGGDGRTTFRLPDMRGRFPVHANTTPGGTQYWPGQSAGSETATLTPAQMPAHSHAVAPASSNGDATSISPAGLAPATKARTPLYAAPTAGEAMAPTQSSVAGGNQPFSIMPPYLTVSCFIATQGVFPSRF